MFNPVMFIIPFVVGMFAAVIATVSARNENATGLMFAINLALLSCLMMLGSIAQILIAFSEVLK